VLSDAAKKGLPGDHHFFISFDTHADGVRISDRLRAQYPEEMTIILQHQFWDLVVEDDRFAITLSFGGRHERLTIPFSALTAFADPSVKFGLQFEANEDELQAKPPALKATKQIESPGVGGNGGDNAGDGGDERKGADVVALDAFRKK